MKKIIFLDIDGVINLEVQGPPEHEERTWTGLLREKMDLLNEIIARTGAHVVVSSSWKKSKTVHQIQDVFVQHGFQGKIVGITPDLQGIGPGMGRGHEIQFWIYQYWPVERFVILDDGCDMVHLQGHLIQTKSRVGLMPGHVEEAIRKLEL